MRCLVVVVAVVAAVADLTTAQSHPAPIRGSSAGFRQSGFGGVSSSSDPCVPSPCGPNTRCTVSRHGIAQCRCLDDFVPDGDTINGCKPQCISDFECGDEFRCQQTKCRRVCTPGACGLHAECRARNHQAQCSCPEGFTGRAEVGCSKKLPVLRAEPPSFHFNPCELGQCAPNADCRVDGDRAVCSCPHGYRGAPDALTHCEKLECIQHTDCRDDEVCENTRCTDPCSPNRHCGPNAQCQARNHAPVCSCPAGFRGDPIHQGCTRLTPSDYCNPSPCGSNTECTFNGERAVCSCLRNYIGDPLNGCRAECNNDRDCPSHQQCKDLRCVNPCAYGACGDNAHCEVRNNVVDCKCPQFFRGNPQISCTVECTSHDDCDSNEACIELQCGNPCTDACGTGADCNVRNHRAICSCPKGFTGHPYESCRRFTDQDLCEPNPCGTNAVCTPGTDRSGEKRPVCTCARGDIGNPLLSCRKGDCSVPDDCGPKETCHEYQCQDACVATTGPVCGRNAICNVNRRHEPVCSCPRGATGDPREECVPLTAANFRAGRT